MLLLQFAWLDATAQALRAFARRATRGLESTGVFPGRGVRAAFVSAGTLRWRPAEDHHCIHGRHGCISTLD